jgi:hypothetical protein
VAELWLYPGGRQTKTALEFFSRNLKATADA